MAFTFEKETTGYKILTDQNIIDIHNATMELMESFGVRIFGQGSQRNL